MGHEREGGSICDSDCDRREKKRTRDRGDDTDVAIPSSKVMKMSLILYTLKATSRFINAISTGRRMIARAEQSRSESVSNYEVIQAELDSHADTCCFSKRHVVVAALRDQTVTVSPFMETMGQVPDVQIADVLVAYDHPIEQKTYILRFNQVLVFDKLSCHLLTPNQMRLNDLIVDECPRVFSESRHQHTHSIRVPDEELSIPLFLDGTNSVFRTRRPTSEDLAECKQIDMTYDMPVYDPHSQVLAEQEAGLIGADYPGIDQDMFSRNVSATTSELSKVSAWHSPVDAMEKLNDDEGYVMTDVMRIASSVTTRKRRGAVTAERLARNWHIGLQTARNTVKATTQKAVRHFDGERPTRRMGSRAEALRFRSLRTFMSTDTKQGPCVSRRGNKYLQVYTSDESWSAVYPIKTRKDVADTLELLFRDAGVPSMLSPDCAPELIGGDFLKKARAAGSLIHPIEPRTPNHQRCETTNNMLSQMYI